MSAKSEYPDGHPNGCKCYTCFEIRINKFEEEVKRKNIIIINLEGEMVEKDLIISKLNELLEYKESQSGQNIDDKYVIVNENFNNNHNHVKCLGVMYMNEYNGYKVSIKYYNENNMFIYRLCFGKTQYDYNKSNTNIIIHKICKNLIVNTIIDAFATDLKKLYGMTDQGITVLKFTLSN